MQDIKYILTDPVEPLSPSLSPETNPGAAYNQAGQVIANGYTTEAFKF